jgi:hypothetical protein
VRTTPCKSTISRNRSAQARSIGRDRPTPSRITGGFDLFDGSHDGYAPLTHRRRVVAIHGELIVVADSVLGSGVHDADVHWHLGDRWESQVNGRQAGLTTAGDSVRLVVPHGIVEEFRAEPGGLGWVSPAYGVVRPSTTLRVRLRAPAPFVVASVFDLNPSNPVEDVESLPVWSEAGMVAQSCGLKIARRESTEYVMFVEPADPSAHGCWRLAEFETDARMLYHRVDPGGRVTRLALADGSYVRSAGRRAFAVALGRSVPALMIDELTIDGYTPCAASPGL